MHNDSNNQLEQEKKELKVDAGYDGEAEEDVGKEPMQSYVAARENAPQNRIDLFKKILPSQEFFQLSADGEFEAYINSLTPAAFGSFIHSMRREFCKVVRKRKHKVETFEQVLEMLKGAKRLLVLTGAGISTSCGIPDFRSASGVYSMLDGYRLSDPQDLFSIHYFKRNTKPFYDFARKLWPGTHKPAPTHHFIKVLEDRNILHRNYTQNIDTLEYVAGISRVLQCHGSFATATCTRCKYKCSGIKIREDIMSKRVPLCPRCINNPRPSLMVEFAMKDPNMRAFRVAGDRSLSISSESDMESDTCHTSSMYPPAGSAIGTSEVSNQSSDTPLKEAEPDTNSSKVCTVPSTTTNRSRVNSLGGACPSPKPNTVTTHTIIEPDSPFASSAKSISHSRSVQRTNSLGSENEIDPPRSPLARTNSLSSTVESADSSSESFEDGSRPKAQNVSSVDPSNNPTKGELFPLTEVFSSKPPLPTQDKQVTTQAKGDKTRNDLSKPTHEQQETTPPTREGGINSDEAKCTAPLETDSKQNMAQPLKHPSDGQATKQKEFSGTSGKREPSTPKSSPSVPREAESPYGNELPFIDLMFDKGIMKPDITFFGESLSDEFFDCIEKDVQQCDLVLVLGTSLKVAPVSRIIEMVDQSIPQILVNRELVAQPHEFDVELLGNCDNVVQALAAALKWDRETTIGTDLDKSFEQSKYWKHRFLFKGAYEDEADDPEEDVFENSVLEGLEDGSGSSTTKRESPDPKPNDNSLSKKPRLDL
mmetsp:Transcript_26381/g.42730  ORF Transcript_26381/g.42730 Transcript_26381/m.42730 type:complete len:762 (+) Transcript_26381:2165-4450(+)